MSPTTQGIADVAEKSWDIFWSKSLPTTVWNPIARHPWPRAPIPAQSSMTLCNESHEGGTCSRIFVLASIAKHGDGKCWTNTQLRIVNNRIPPFNKPLKANFTPLGTITSKWCSWVVSKTSSLQTRLQRDPTSASPISKGYTMAQNTSPTFSEIYCTTGRNLGNRSCLKPPTSVVYGWWTQ